MFNNKNNSDGEYKIIYISNQFESKSLLLRMFLFGNMQYRKYQHGSIMLMHYSWKMSLAEKFKKLNTEQLIAEGQLRDLV